jgi:hypothetical protein
MKRQILKAALLTSAIFATGNVDAQCVAINCPANITVNNTPNTCGAVVNYTAPVGYNPCATGADTFQYTGSIVNWTVPTGITTITVEARGAEGGYNTSSGTTPGLGATIKGTFTVVPGSQLKILVGQQPTNSLGNGGGGGSFVTDASNNPLVVAGGGAGSSELYNQPDKNGQTTTAGANGQGGGGTGGTGGNGGGTGPSGFQSGAGGGLLTNGADGWTSGTGGKAFVNGGAGGTGNGNANGGFGGGGTGSAYIVGGAGGGYSGGGSGSNAAGSGGPGGGGGSYNGGTNQTNTSGVNSGNGLVIISYSVGGNPITTALASGLGSGANFPVGVNTETYLATDGVDTVYCSTTITVVDNQAPVISCGGNVTTCNPLVTNIAPVSVTEKCPGVLVTYTLTGATTGSGNTDASGTIFQHGVTTVQYIARDTTGNADTCSFTVTMNGQVISMNHLSPDTVCLYHGNIILPTAMPAGGTYSGAGVSGGFFNTIAAGPGHHWIKYTYTANGCTNVDSTGVTVIACLGVANPDINATMSVYPNPSNGNVEINLGNMFKDVDIEIAQINGQVVSQQQYRNTSLIKTDISKFAAGVYLLTVRADGQQARVKLVRE